MATRPGPRFIVAVLLTLALASWATTALAWILTGRLEIMGLVNGAAFLGVAVATPFLSRRRDTSPPCRSCHGPVTDTSFGFCLRCGQTDPLRVRRATA